VTLAASSVTVPGSERSHVLNELDEWTQYKVWIAAATNAGEGPLSDVIVVQTDEDSTCSTVHFSNHLTTTAKNTSLLGPVFFH